MAGCQCSERNMRSERNMHTWSCPRSLPTNRTPSAAALRLAVRIATLGPQNTNQRPAAELSYDRQAHAAGAAGRLLIICIYIVEGFGSPAGRVHCNPHDTDRAHTVKPPQHRGHRIPCRRQRLLHSTASATSASDLCSYRGYLRLFHHEHEHITPGRSIRVWRKGMGRPRTEQAACDSNSA